MCQLLSGNGESLVTCILLDLKVVFSRLSAAVKKYSLKLFAIVGGSRIIVPLGIKPPRMTPHVCVDKQILNS